MLKQVLIYVVDDDEIITSTVTMILEASGFEVAGFRNPLDALKAVETRPPDVLLSDVIMRQMHGIDLAVKVKTLCPSCKVLLLSGQAQTADLLDEARLQGHVFPILAKPIHPTDLIAAIRNLSAGNAP